MTRKNKFFLASGEGGEEADRLPTQEKKRSSSKHSI